MDVGGYDEGQISQIPVCLGVVNTSEIRFVSLAASALDKVTGLSVSSRPL